MPSKSELNLMTQILDLEGFNVIDYRLIEDIAIILSLENTKKEGFSRTYRAKQTNVLSKINIKNQAISKRSASRRVN